MRRKTSEVKGRGIEMLKNGASSREVAKALGVKPYIVENWKRELDPEDYVYIVPPKEKTIHDLPPNFADEWDRARFRILNAGRRCGANG